jgi:hypothetical protein
MTADVQRFANDLASDATMLDDVRQLGTDVARIVEYAAGRGYRFTADELDDLADHYDRASNPLVYPGLRRQGWHLKPQS